MKNSQWPDCTSMGLPTPLKNLRVPELRFHTACGSQDITTHSTFNSNEERQGRVWLSNLSALNLPSEQHSQVNSDFLQTTALLEEF